MILVSRAERSHNASVNAIIIAERRAERRRFFTKTVSFARPAAIIIGVMATMAGATKARFKNFSGYKDFEDHFLALCKSAEITTEVSQIGESVEGRAIWTVSLGDADPSAPGVLYSSLTHGHEFVAGDMCLDVLRWFLSPENRDASMEMLSRARAHFLPVANPDANERAHRELRKYGVSFARKNANGVDLNRNFPAHFYPEGGSPVMASNLPFTLVYRGEGPLSEPESRAFRDFVEKTPLRASLAIHSPGRFIGYPFCHTNAPCPHSKEMRAVADAMRARQPFFKYRVGSEFTYLPTSGDLDDWLYEEHGIFAFLLEVGKLGLRFEDPATWLNMYAWCNAPEAEKEIANNIDACVYFARWAAGLEK